MASVDPSQTIAMPSSGKETTSSDQIEDAKSAIDLAVPDMKEQRATLTDQENKLILRKTDKYVLSILVWLYFLQILDKSVLGYGSLFGLQKDTNLVGTQYSLVGSMAAIAQLCWLPFSSFLIVKVPHRTLMSVLVFGWGTAQTCMAASHNYAGLLATRFFLGLFEAACLPLFSVITSQWYRRAEQPVRVATWYGTNGLATIFGSALSYGLGHIPSDTLKSWQIIFLFVGLVTVASSPLTYWKLDNNVETARFLTEHERAQAIERLRANNTGIGSREFKWSQVLEVFTDPKTYLWFAMALLLNVGAAVANVFGPLILASLEFNKYTTSLLNMPFGAVQLLVILLSSYAAYKAKLKGVILAVIMIPVVVGLAVLYALPRTKTYLAANLVAYYLIAFIFGGNPLLVTWLVGNTAGTTKKTVLMVVYNIGVSAGNIIGPLLFTSGDAPNYRPGLRAVMGLFIALIGVILVQWTLLFSLNKSQERKRVANGKPAKIIDRSMMNRYTTEDYAETGTGEEGLQDLTDRQNDEFVYIY